MLIVVAALMSHLFTGQINLLSSQPVFNQAGDRATFPEFDFETNCRSYADDVDNMYANRRIAQKACISQERRSSDYLRSVWETVSPTIQRNCLGRPEISKSYKYGVLLVCVRALQQEERLRRSDR